MSGGIVNLRRELTFDDDLVGLWSLELDASCLVLGPQTGHGLRLLGCLKGGDSREPSGAAIDADLQALEPWQLPCLRERAFSSKPQELISFTRIEAAPRQANVHGEPPPVCRHRTRATERETSIIGALRPERKRAKQGVRCD